MLLLVTVFGTLLGTVGCSKQAEIEPSEPMCLSLAGKQDMMETAQWVLKRKQFVIEKYDIDAGYIVTRPMRGSQFFEPWRGDNVGSANKGASNIHSIERVVSMNFTQDTGQLCIECIADKRRFSMPEKQLESISQAAGSFVGSGSRVMKLNPETEEEMAWIDLGRDGALEMDILQRIKQKSTEVK